MTVLHNSSKLLRLTTTKANEHLSWQLIRTNRKDLTR